MSTITCSCLLRDVQEEQSTFDKLGLRWRIFLSFSSAGRMFRRIGTTKTCFYPLGREGQDAPFCVGSTHRPRTVLRTANFVFGALCIPACV